MNGDRGRSDEETVAAVRDYFEHELQEAGSRLREPHRPARRTRSAHRGFASIAILGVVAIVIATTMRVVVLAPGSSTTPTASPVASAPAGSPASSPGTSSSSPGSPTSAPLTGDLPGPVSLSGTSAWMLLDSGLSVSDDAGRTWATVALPSGVVSSAVAAEATAPGRPIWLAVKSGDGYLLYRKADAAAAWSSVLLTPSWALLSSTSGPADMVEITAGAGGIVTVAETMSGGSTSAVTSLFVSTDDGSSFVQHPPRSGSLANTYWASVTFATAQDGLVIAGPDTYPHVFLYTSDGGSTWSESKVTGLPAAPNYTPGPPMLVGSDIQVPVTICETVCSTSAFLLLVSHDGGASFNPQGVGIPAAANPIGAVGSLGQNIWVTTGGGPLQETTDGGRTWTSVVQTGLPVNISVLDLTGPTSATAVVIDSGCASNKTNCWYRNYLVATTDGGRTWTHL
jgi:photosystem II stability/assembly factor-like uncharacterized protein